MKNVLSITVLSLLVVATGCRSPKMPLTPAQQGAVVGGSGGAVVGAVMAQNANASLSSWQGAGAGAVAGVAAGALVGDALDEYAYDNASGMKDKDAQINDLQRQLADAEAKLRGQGMDNVKVEAVNGQLRFTILNEVLFESGKAELKTGSKSTIDSVLNIIQSDFANRDITIEGHTDSDPIMKSKWKDNWELSYNRSMAVLYYLMNEKGIPAERLKAVACADSQPVAPNDSAANKRLNRRAVIVVMPAKDSIIVEKK
ncbi:MAG TPA: OmpA family protein [Pontiellaceae bacterium]|nr:OmpA family protein [Pontiellaceae bacterium]HPR82549.1 OmpA family protein [Pontiellaceae bacterium]